MRRPLVLPAVLALMLALPLMSQAAPAGTKVADLFAGKTTDVGDVFVWNDATNYYVEINMDDAWCMTESHVIVAALVADIPQANGNPIPGRFPQGDSYNPCADGDTFTFAVADVGVNPYVAVHVKAWEKTISTATIVSNPGTSNPVKFASDYPTFGAAVPAVVPTFAGWPAIAGASYISNQAAGDPFNMNAWRSVTETLNVPGLPVGGQLWVNSDNYEFTKLNGIEIQRDDNGPASTVEGTDPEPVVSPQTWQTIANVAFAPKMGSNTFEFVFRNVIWEGCCGFTDNPTGLIYKASATYYAHSESAWAGTAPGVSPFSGKNWATYFRYAVVDWADSNGDWVYYNAYGTDRQAMFSFGAGGGEFSYDDATGVNAYHVTLTQGAFSADTAYACGTVDGGAFLGSKLLLKVTDTTVDVVWGSFVSDPCTNLGTVTPGDGPFTITSGEVNVLDV